MRAASLRTSRRRSRGVTLIELLVVMTLAAIVLAIGVPNFSHLLERNRATAISNEFLRAVTQARAEAMARGQRAVVAPVGGAWANGWEVFVDADRDAVRDGNELLLFSFSETAGITIDPNFATGWNNVLVFMPTGQSRAAADGTTIIDGRMSFTAGSEQRSVCLSALGRASVVRGNTCP